MSPDNHELGYSFIIGERIENTIGPLLRRKRTFVLPVRNYRRQYDQKQNKFKTPFHMVIDSIKLIKINPFVAKDH